MPIERALIIDTPHIDRILSGEKTWELRSSHTKIRGPVGLIRKGSGQVVGTAEIVDSIGPLTTEQLEEAVAQHRVTPERLRSGLLSKYRYAWCLKNARKLSVPVTYQHPSGAVKWVILSADISARL